VHCRRLVRVPLIRFLNVRTFYIAYACFFILPPPLTADTRTGSIIFERDLRLYCKQVLEYVIPSLERARYQGWLLFISVSSLTVPVWWDDRIWSTFQSSRNDIFSSCLGYLISSLNSVTATTLTAIRKTSSILPFSAQVDQSISNKSVPLYSRKDTTMILEYTINFWIIFQFNAHIVSLVHTYCVSFPCRYWSPSHVIHIFRPLPIARHLLLNICTVYDMRLLDYLTAQIQYSHFTRVIRHN
jgi:hypothetical protein